MRMLNLGCGAIFHEDWVNIDFTDHGAKVLAYDLSLGIPFADHSFDVVYHSHVLEHFPKAWGEFFIAECYRVLRPGGHLRVVVPDLENITRAYLEAMEAVRRGEEGAEGRHQWMLVELIDQLTRGQSGGEMLNWWKQAPVPQESFIMERLGKEAEIGIALAEGQAPSTPKTALPPVDVQFVFSDEVRKWMYDAVSLERLLRQNGFENIQQVAHNESALPQITQYGLDTQKDGRARKPASFFMEAKKSSVSEAKTKRVTMFSTTDSGGAAIAALRLHKALHGIKIQSHMYVAEQSFFQNRVHVIPSSLITAGSGLARDGQQSEKALRKEFVSYWSKLCREIKRFPERPIDSEHFSTLGQCVPLEHVPFLEDSDIIHLHWVTGLLDPSLSLEFLRGKKIVWTLHDMNAFTGGCHYSNGCRKFEKMCGACPELGSTQERDLAFSIWRARMGAYRELNIHVVAPSKWLAEEAKKSALLGRFPVHHIPYAQPLHIFRPLERESIRQQMGLEPNSLALMFVSQDLVNTRKGNAYLVELLQVLAQTPLKDRVVVFLVGKNASSKFTNKGIKVKSFGHVHDIEEMVSIYNAADAVLVPSLEDNQPNVICEALGCGTPVVAFDSGGIGEMINHKQTGYLAATKSLEGLLNGVVWADGARNPMVRRLCRASAVEQWDPDKGAKAYENLYNNL